MFPGYWNCIVGTCPILLHPKTLLVHQNVQCIQNFVDFSILNNKENNSVRVFFAATRYFQIIFPGHGTFIGEKSGKCTGYGVKSTDCRKCLFTNDPTDHDCRKNFAGSAKSMEAAIATDLTSRIMELGYRINCITMDEDSTTINRVKTCVDPEIEKKSDKNHIKKSLSNSLYSIKKDHKLLSVTVINYLVKCACYAISQNKENPENLDKTLRAIIPHAFGEHGDCNESWCG